MTLLSTDKIDASSLVQGLNVPRRRQNNARLKNFYHQAHGFMGCNIDKNFMTTFSHGRAKLLGALVAILVFSYSILPVGSDTIIETRNGQKYILPIESHDIESIEAVPAKERRSDKLGNHALSPAVTQPNQTVGSSPPDSQRPLRSPFSHRDDRKPAQSRKWNVSMITAMAPGTWLAYGEPWTNVRRALAGCSTPFENIMLAWTSGAIDDQGNFWIASAGGHGDGCDQSVYRYNIDTGQPEIVVDHIPFTHSSLEGPNETPYTGDVDGNIIQPRSTHNYNGTHIIDGFLYRSDQGVWPHGQGGVQNWRLNIAQALAAPDNDAANAAWERLADTSDFNRMAPLADGTIISANQWSFCEFDWVTGATTNCSNNLAWFGSSGHNLYGSGDSVWGVGQTGSAHLYRKFNRDAQGIWNQTRSIGLPPNGWNNGAFGACIVPTSKGDVPVLWSRDTELVAWVPNGDTVGKWVTLSAPNGPAENTTRKVYGKWNWSDRLQACVGADTVSDGLWIYKPDIAVLIAASNTGTGLLKEGRGSVDR